MTRYWQWLRNPKLWLLISLLFFLIGAILAIEAAWLVATRQPSYPIPIVHPNDRLWQMDEWACQAVEGAIVSMFFLIAGALCYRNSRKLRPGRITR